MSMKSDLETANKRIDELEAIATAAIGIAEQRGDRLEAEGENLRESGTEEAQLHYARIILRRGQA